MLNRLRVEPPAILLFMDNLTQSFYRTARENWLHARTAHTASLEISNAGLLRMEAFHLAFPCHLCIIRRTIFVILFFSCLENSLYSAQMHFINIGLHWAIFARPLFVNDLAFSAYSTLTKWFSILNGIGFLIVTNFHHSARSIPIFQLFCILLEKSRFNKVSA